MNPDEILCRNDGVEDGDDMRSRLVIMYKGQVDHGDNVSMLSLGDQSYIHDLANQKQYREERRQEEALEEALELFKVAVDKGAPKTEELFQAIMEQVVRELNEENKEKDRLQDEWLEEALQEELERQRGELSMSDHHDHHHENIGSEGGDLSVSLHRHEPPSIFNDGRSTQLMRRQSSIRMLELDQNIRNEEKKILLKKIAKAERLVQEIVDQKGIAKAKTTKNYKALKAKIHQYKETLRNAENNDLLLPSTHGEEDDKSESENTDDFASESSSSSSSSDDDENDDDDDDDDNDDDDNDDVEWAKQVIAKSLEGPANDGYKPKSNRVPHRNISNMATAATRRPIGFDLRTGMKAKVGALAPTTEADEENEGSEEADEAEVRRLAEEENLKKEAEAERIAEEERLKKEQEEIIRRDAEAMAAAAESKRIAEAERFRKAAKEEKLKKEQEEMLRKEAEAKAVAEAKRKAEAERLRKEAEEEKFKKEQEMLRKEAEAKAVAEAKRKAEAERLRKEAEEEKFKKEQEMLRKEAEAKAVAEAKRKAEAERLRKEAEAKKEAEAERRKVVAEERLRKEAQAKREAEAKKKAEMERVQKEAETKAAAKAKREAVVKRKAEEEERFRKEAERKREADAERFRKVADAKGAEDRLRKDAQTKRQAEAKKRAEVERLSRVNPATEAKAKKKNMTKKMIAEGAEVNGKGEMEEEKKTPDGDIVIRSEGDIYVALTLNVEEAPTPEDYESILKLTTDFYAKRLKQVYPGSFKQIKIAVRNTLWNASIPTKHYNVYMEWGFKAYFDKSAPKVPRRHDLCKVMVAANLMPYMQELMRMRNPPFNTIRGAYTKQTK